MEMESLTLGLECFVGALVLLFAMKKPTLVGIIALLGAGIIGNLMYGSTSVPIVGTDIVGGRTTMNAAYFAPGAPHDVEVSRDVPLPARHMYNQLFVEVTAAGLNPSNFKINLKRIPIVRHLATHYVVGYDFVGTVRSVGSAESCAGFKVGDRIYGVATGSMAEFAVAMCGMVGHAPRSLSDAQVAGLPVAALTSLEAWERGGLQPGQRVLVIGASGGTGIFGVTIAKVMGAHVTGVCSARNKEFVQGLTPAPDRLVDYTSAAEIAALVAEGRQFDIVYDTVTSFAPEDPDYEPQMAPLLKPGGQYIAINGHYADWVRGLLDALVVAPLVGRPGLVQRKDYCLFLLDPSTRIINLLSGYFDQGLLRDAPIDSTFRLERADMHRAFERMKGRRTVGKIIIDVRAGR
jgi:NADPH:quinone reductase-like Zn-dependent oxidoreductase